jgi:hypothetical protein
MIEPIFLLLGLTGRVIPTPQTWAELRSSEGPSTRSVLNMICLVIFTSIDYLKQYLPSCNLLHNGSFTDNKLILAICTK